MFLWLYPAVSLYFLRFFRQIHFIISDNTRIFLIRLEKTFIFFVFIHPFSFLFFELVFKLFSFIFIMIFNSFS